MDTYNLVSEFFISTILVLISYISIRKVSNDTFVRKDEFNEKIHDEVSLNIKKVIDHRLSSFIIEVQTFIDKSFDNKLKVIDSHQTVLYKQMLDMSDKLDALSKKLSK